MNDQCKVVVSFWFLVSESYFYRLKVRTEVIIRTRSPRCKDFLIDGTDRVSSVSCKLVHYPLSHSVTHMLSLFVKLFCLESEMTPESLLTGSIHYLPY